MRAGGFCYLTKPKAWNLNRVLCCALVLVFVLASPVVFAAGKSKKYIIGVFPHLSTAHLERTFGAISNRLRVSTGKRFDFSAFSNLENFRQDLEAGVYDLVFLQPFDYVKAREQHGYEILVAQDRPLETVFLVRSDSLIKTAEDLQGKTILIPPKTTAVSYMAKDWLSQQGLKPGVDYKLAHETTHVGCLHKVLVRQADVCATVNEAVEFFEEKLGIDFRSVAATEVIPHTLFAVHPRVPSSLKTQIAESLLELSESASGNQILVNGRLAPFRSAKDSEYDLVRKVLQRAD